MLRPLCFKSKSRHWMVEPRLNVGSLVDHWNLISKMTPKTKAANITKETSHSIPIRTSFWEKQSPTWRTKTFATIWWTMTPSLSLLPIKQYGWIALPYSSDCLLLSWDVMQWRSCNPCERYSEMCGHKNQAWISTSVQNPLSLICLERLMLEYYFSLTFCFWGVLLAYIWSSKSMMEKQIRCLQSVCFQVASNPWVWDIQVFEAKCLGSDGRFTTASQAAGPEKQILFRFVCGCLWGADSVMLIIYEYYGFVGYCGLLYPFVILMISWWFCCAAPFVDAWFHIYIYTYIRFVLCLYSREGCATSVSKHHVGGMR